MYCTAMLYSTTQYGCASVVYYDYEKSLSLMLERQKFTFFFSLFTVFVLYMFFIQRNFTNLKSTHYNCALDLENI